eukprot:Sspe_Gene.5152::Locus_1698_Transcript_2_2_Confidence_0.750_Length_13180::g.5152::m.5152
MTKTSGGGVFGVLLLAVAVHVKAVTVDSQHNGYNGTMEPPTFTEGQEFRISLFATVGGDTKVERFNTSLSELTVRTYAAKAGLTCDQYVSAEAMLQEVTSFGLSDTERIENNEIVGYAHATLSAPSHETKFVICFKHVTDKWVSANPSWQMFSVDQVTEWRATESLTWYHLPDPTVGQYAIIQLLGDEAWNFTYSPSACGNANTEAGLVTCTGDNLKIVPTGKPCTYEHQDSTYPYLGSSFVDSDGKWVSAAWEGLREGATAGGVGRFGTQYANPLVDSWTQDGEYYPANEEAYTHTSVSTSVTLPNHAYVYVRLPPTTGSFDVCFSSREQRKEWRTANSTLDAIPVWRKLSRCTDPNSCRTNDASMSFTVRTEPVGWSMFDVTPKTWGTLIFDDSGEGGLSRAASTSTFKDQPALAYPAPSTAKSNYWDPQGGDFFRLVEASMFGEDEAMFAGNKAGSPPKAGCWSRASEVPGTPGGLVEDKVIYPLASHDLADDPSLASGREDDAAMKKTAYSTVYVPQRWTKWYVCYRRTCTGGGCAKHSGMRVLAWHYSGVGAVPAKWHHLETRYTPGMASAPHQLIPLEYDWDSWVKSPYPPAATWYMNDTRSGTWGPLVVEKANVSALGELDTRPWNFVREWSAPTDSIAATVGSTIRLVKSDEPCDFPKFGGPQSLNGGAVECNSADAERDTKLCLGSALDSATADSMAFYLTLPDPGAYRVCHRVHGWNWRELSSSDAGPAPGDDNQPSGARQRGEWNGGETLLKVTEEATLKMTSLEDRAGMEALFIITDSRKELSPGGRRQCEGGCDASGDVLRLVPVGEGCDVTPSKWVAQNADTHLQLYCQRAGSGDVAKSGLYDMGSGTPSACAASAAARSLCGGKVCNSNANTVRLGEAMALTPDLYDDIVPGDHEDTNVESVAGVITVPGYKPSESNRYMVCYKQMGTANWVVFNDTWEVQKPVGWTVASSGTKLLAGELHRFQIDFDRDVISPQGGILVAGVNAKLVVADEKSDNDHCVSPPAGTEGSEFGSATKTVQGVSGKATSLEFYLTVPHKAGKYHLCVQVRETAEDSMSWMRSGTHEVLDNEVRWFVTAGNQPTNLGLSVVNLLRCRAGKDSCDASASDETFNTDRSPWGDEAKVVAVGDSCSSGTQANKKWGASTHIGVEGQPVKDLGPGEGPADVAEMLVTLPRLGGDVRRKYKVCVMTTFRNSNVGGSRKAWVEVAQAHGVPEQWFVNGDDGRSGFVTEAGLLDYFDVAAQLRPATNLFGSSPKGEAVVLAGASTWYIPNPNTAKPSPPADGFEFVLHGGSPSGAIGPSNLFKLVRTASPPSGGLREQGWQEASNWEAVPGASCLGPAVDSASNLGSCADLTKGKGGECPSVGEEKNGRVPVDMHFPLAVGKYYVCYKVNHTSLALPRPWLWVPSKHGDTALYTHPTFLEFEVGAKQDNLTVYDLRTVQKDGLATSLSSWCSREDEVNGEGVPCTSQNTVDPTNPQGFRWDLLTVVNDTQVCPAPTAGPAGSAEGVPEWYQLIRTGNATASVWNTWDAPSKAFALPPTGAVAESGRYKVCVYKAGEPKFSLGGHVAREGVVYQLARRHYETGYWEDPIKGKPTQLLVSHDLMFNSSIRFVEVASGAEMQTLYGENVVPAEWVTDSSTGMLSRTPIIQSGESVGYTVTVATSSGQLVPSGSYAVDVLRCAAAGSSWGLLDCATATGPDSAGAFEVYNKDGQCSTTYGHLYGWPSNGLRQFATDGKVHFALQYRSRCPDGAFGCGVKFSAKVGSETIMSRPQWVNVARRWPDAVEVNGVEAYPTMSGNKLDSTNCGVATPLCPHVYCMHSTECKLHLRARWKGPVEYSAEGKVAVTFSEKDYGDVTAVPATVKALLGDTVKGMGQTIWGTSGTADYVFTPKLQTGKETGTVFLNVTYGKPSDSDTSWTRVVLTVTRQVPKMLVPKEVITGDLMMSRGSRTPAPIFKGIVSGTGMHAAPGAYLEALVPYLLRYNMLQANAEEITTTVGLDGWNIAASFVGSTAATNKILTVLWDGNRPAASNLQTSPKYTSAELTQAPSGDAEGWGVWFRVLNNVGCSRFSGGCTIMFKLTKAGAKDVEMTLKTPVRVIASGIKVEVDKAVSTVREGITVTALPGTPCGVGCWLADEFHYGDIFALIAAPGTTDGTATQDRTVMEKAVGASENCVFANNGKCTVWGYSAKVLSGNKWGSQWLMRPSKPCRKCEFTFHSTLGTSPDSLTQAGSETTELTFDEETVELKCPGDITVKWVEGMTTSNTFDVAVRTVVAGKTPETGAHWPRWWVFTSKQEVGGAAGYELGWGKGTTPGVISKKMGEGAVATITGLSFTGTQGPGASSGGIEKTITFRARGAKYSTTAPGSVVTETVPLSCNVRVFLVHEPAPEPVTTMSVKSVTGATALCGAPEGCRDWTATVDQAKTGVRFTFAFTNTTAGEAATPDSTSRNLTVLAKGGPGSTSDDITWTPRAGVSEYTSQSIVLDSSFNQADLFKVGTHTYSYGRPTVVFVRGENVGANGEGWVSVAYADGVTQEPVRKAVFHVCGWKDGKLEKYCVEIRLWIRAQTSASVALWQEPTEGEKVPGPCAKNPTLMTFRAVTYQVAGDTRIIMYDRPTKYSLTCNGQALNAVGSVLMNNSVSVTNPVKTGQSEAQRVLHEYHETLRTPMLVYGWNEVGSATDMRTCTVAASFPESPSETVAAATTTAKYFWKLPDETYSTWSIANTPTMDDECPKKRFLATTTNGYRTYEDTPGEGVGHSVVFAGVPFPLQAQVLTKDGGRSWSFPTTMVRVQKHSWHGCNDGGVMTVHSLSPSAATETVALRTGALSSFTTGTVRTGHGVASIWPVFQRPCEACTIEVDLCYTGATGEADCLAPASAKDAKADKEPVLGDRMKVTKAIRVIPAKADVVHAYEQTTPSGVEPSSVHYTREMPTVLVGKVFTMKLEQVRKIGKWAMVWSTEVKSVSVHSDWVVKSEEEVDGARMMYGNGGFLSVPQSSKIRSTVPGTGCDVTSEELAQARMASTITEWPLLRFFFTRPCSRCRVIVKYEVGDVSSSFVMRGYTTGAGEVPTVGSELVYRVATCPTAWMLGGVPPVAVRRRRTFSLTALRVDGNLFPAMEGSNDATVSLDLSASGGNGGGGVLTVSSPGTHAAGTVTTKASAGSATVRLSMSRACFRCRVVFALKPHDFTVLTDATQIVAIPAKKSDMLQVFGNSSTTATWQFDLYAADDLGDRAYTAGGPTPLTFHPLHFPHVSSGVTLGARVSGTKAYEAVSAGLTVTSLSTGTPTAKVVNGTKVFNGVPFGEMENEMVPPGTAIVELSEKPGMVDLGFNLGAASLPTNLFGTKKAPTATFSVVPAFFAITDPTKGTCKSTLAQGGGCAFQAFAMGKIEGDVSNNYFVTGHPVEGEVKVTAACNGCNTNQGTEAVVVTPSAMNFTNGVVDFSLRVGAVGKACGCSVTVTPPPSLVNGTQQKFDISLEPTPMTQWKWVASPNLMPVVSGSRATADSVFNRTVALRLMAYDSKAMYSGLGGLTWSANEVTVSGAAMTPAGCFVCSSPTQDDKCTVTVNNTDDVVLEGYFPATGKCVIAGEAVKGFPVSSGSAVSASTALEVTVQVPADVQTVSAMTPGMEQVNFTKLTASLLNGEPAGVAGVGVVMQLQVMQGDSTVATGDYHTTLSVTGKMMGNTTGRNDTTWGPVVKTVKGGMAHFAIDVPPTRKEGCAMDAMCEHTPWMFTVVASSPLLPGKEGATITETTLHAGPLYVVREAVMLKVEMQSWGEWKSLEGMRWVTGFPTSFRVTALDHTGKQVKHQEDRGHDAEIVFRPVAIPCREMDVAKTNGMLLLRKTCVKDGECEMMSFASLPACGAHGWTLGQSGIEGHELRLQGGEVTVKPVVYTGEGAELFDLTSADLQGDGADYSLRREVVFQRIAGIGLEGCTQGPCDMPVKNVTAMTDIELQVRVGDSTGAVVVADNHSRIVVSSSCSNHTATSLLAVFSGGEVDPLTPMIFPVVNGVAQVKGVAFSNPCENMTVTFRCESSSSVDTAGDCNGKEFSTVVFPVGLSENATPKPSYPPPAPVRLSLLLKKFVAATFDEARNLFLKFQVADTAAFLKKVLRNMQVVKDVVLSWLCALPEERASTGPTELDRTNQTNDSLCYSYMSTPDTSNPNSSNPNTSTASFMPHFLEHRVHPLAEVTLVAHTEFLISASESAGGVTPAAFEQAVIESIKQDLNSNTSILRTNPAFAEVDANQLSSTVIQTPVPTNPDGSIVVTPQPPTPEPPPPTPEPTSTPAPTPNPTPQPPPPPPKDDYAPIQEEAGVAVTPATAFFTVAVALLAMLW